jgi:hypothetical protein
MSMNMPNWTPVPQRSGHQRRRTMMHAMPAPCQRTPRCRQLFRPGTLVAALQVQWLRQVRLDRFLTPGPGNKVSG